MKFTVSVLKLESYFSFRPRRLSFLPCWRSIMVILWQLQVPWGCSVLLELRFVRYKAFPSFDRFVSWRAYQNLAKSACCPYIHESILRYLCAVCGMFYSNQGLLLKYNSNIFCHKIPYASSTKPQQQGKQVDCQSSVGPICMSSLAWWWRGGTGSRMKLWRKVAVPRETVTWGQRLTSCWGWLAKSELSCISSSEEMVMVDVRCLALLKLAAPGLIKPHSSPHSNNKACTSILFCLSSGCLEYKIENLSLHKYTKGHRIDGVHILHFHSYI